MNSIKFVGQVQKLQGQVNKMLQMGANVLATAGFEPPACSLVLASLSMPGGSLEPKCSSEGAGQEQRNITQPKGRDPANPPGPGAYELRMELAALKKNITQGKRTRWVP